RTLDDSRSKFIRRYNSVIDKVHIGINQSCRYKAELHLSDPHTGAESSPAGPPALITSNNSIHVDYIIDEIDESEWHSRDLPLLLQLLPLEGFNHIYSISNNRSLKQGGRFYGPVYQQLP